MEMSRKMWIDTDMGSDDAVALIMALQSEDIEVVGISALSGNVPLEQATLNARFIAELCESDVPVYAGADKPLLRPYVDATWFHGIDGLSGYGGIPQQKPEKAHAVDALIAASHQYEDLILVTLGPLTNIALAVARDPSIISNISRCVVMGGAACTYGNVTPAAEYNIWVDPDAARMTFLSGLAVEMVGWEFCQGEFALSKDEMEQVRNLDTPLAHFTLNCNEVAIQAYYKQTKHHGLSLPDPVAMAVALDKTIATDISPHYVEIETQSDLTRGITLVDKLDVVLDSRNENTWAQAIQSGKNVEVTWAIDSPRWKQMLYDSLL